jgi:hypothetical protein
MLQPSDPNALPSVPYRQRAPLRFIGQYLDEMLNDFTTKIVSGEAERILRNDKKKVREAFVRGNAAPTLGLYQRWSKYAAQSASATDMLERRTILR